MGPTLFDSPVWWEKNWECVPPPLGQIIGDKIAWNPGDPPILRPRNVTVGSSTCIANGESISSGLRLDNPNRFGSWPLACLVESDVNDWGRWADVYVCRVQQYWVTRLLEMDGGQIDRLLDTLLETFPGSACRWDAGQQFLPPCFTVVHPQYAIAGIQATSNAEQALVEVIQGVLGPVDVGGFSTARLWHDQATRVLGVLEAQGANPNAPILFVGHSYGGAAAAVCAAMCRLARPNRIIRFLTFGSPRPGDVRLSQLCGLPTRGLAMVNQGDLIGSIPPDLADLLPAQLVLGVDLTNFDRWIPVRETWLQRPDGEVLPNEFPVIATADLVELIDHVWTHGTFFGYPAHTLLEYRIRIFLRCAGDLAAVGAVAFGLQLAPGNLELAGIDAQVQPLVIYGLEVGTAKLSVSPGLPRGVEEIKTPYTQNDMPTLQLGPPYKADGNLDLTNLSTRFIVQGKLSLIKPQSTIALGPLGLGFANSTCRTRFQAPYDTDFTFDVMPRADVWWEIPSGFVFFGSNRLRMSATDLTAMSVGMFYGSCASLGVYGVFTPPAACASWLGAAGNLICRWTNNSDVVQTVTCRGAIGSCP